MFLNCYWCWCDFSLGAVAFKWLHGGQMKTNCVLLFVKTPLRRPRVKLGRVIGKVTSTNWTLTVTGLFLNKYFIRQSIVNVTVPPSFVLVVGDGSCFSSARVIRCNSVLHIGLVVIYGHYTAINLRYLSPTTTLSVILQRFTIIHDTLLYTERAQ